MAIQVFISYSHDSNEQLDRIWDLSERLRRDGIDCVIDQQVTWPAEGWPRWCKKQLENAKFCLVVCTEKYERRYEGKEDSGIGLGANFEGFIITQEIYESTAKNTKFIPIVFAKDDVARIPKELRPFTHFDVSADSDYENLFRILSDQPAKQAGPVGPLRNATTRTASLPAASVAVPSLPSPLVTKVERKQDFSASMWNVPVPPNPFFTGREEEIDELKSALESTGSVALSGLGGVGKSQCAAHYAYTHRHEYRAVLWAAAESEESLKTELVKISSVMGLPESQAREQGIAANAAMRWFESNDDWLLILDNAENPIVAHRFESTVRAKRRHLLLTTQAHAVGALERVELKPMPPEDGLLLLLRRARVFRVDPSEMTSQDVQVGLARTISDELGGLPLALDQAGAYIDETGCGLRTYLDLYRQDSVELLKRRGRSATEHDSVARTFTLSFAKVESANPASAELLRLCAFLHADAVPEEIITKGGAELGPVLSSVASKLVTLNDALGETLKYSLLQRDPDSSTLSIHRVVQAVIKSLLSEAQKTEWPERVVNAVSMCFPEPDIANWASCERLLPNAQNCSSLIELKGINSEAAVRLLHRVAMYLVHRGRFNEAESPYKYALAIQESRLGLDHPDVVRVVNDLGHLYCEQKRFAAANTLLQRSLAVREKSLGADDPDLATSLGNLGSLWLEEGKYTAAEPLMQRALAIREMVLGPEHPDLGNSIHNLAALYHAQGKFVEAERLNQRALAILEKALGPEHPAVADSLDNLAGLIGEQGRGIEAEPLLQRALAIREKVLGPEHPDVATSLNNLAALRHDQDKDLGAESMLQRALAIREKTLGPEHQDLAISLKNLGMLYRRTGRYAEAESLYQRALAIREKALGPEHPRVAALLENLAVLYHDKNRHALAKSFEKRAKEIRAKNAKARTITAG